MELFKDDMILYKESVKDWKEAIYICAKPLIENGYIECKYVEAVFEMAEKLGPYFDFGKKIAVPHARPESGAIKTGLSILQLADDVNLLYDEEHPINTFILLVAEDNGSHVEMLKELSKFLMDKEKINLLKQSSNVDEMKNIINRR